MPNSTIVPTAWSFKIIPRLQQPRFTDCEAYGNGGDATGSSPNQSNWTGAPITIPAGTDVEWMSSGGVGGSWTALSFEQSDYIQPDGTGAVSLHSISGTVRLHPGGTGAVQWVSDSQTTGCTITIGAGTPQNVVSAPPGSDYRNLTGGAGTVFWVKQTGTGSTGWVAVA
jgi:hypothetical protein